MLLYAVTLTVIAVAQLWLLIAVSPSVLVGDEKDYLRRGAMADPHQPGVYLRVPLFPELARWISRLAASPLSVWRWFNALLAIATAGLILWLALSIGGETALLVSGASLLLLIERQILAQHIWPDTLLAFFNTLLLFLLLTFPVSATVALWLGVVLMLAVMTRIEQIVLLPGVMSAVSLTHGHVDSTVLVLMAAPTVLSLLLWTILARLRYGINWPDTTWMFNVDLLREEIGIRQRGRHRINPLVREVHLKWMLRKAKGKTFDRVRTTKRSLLKWVYALAAKVLSFWGSDSFVVGRLLPPAGYAYPDMAPGLSRFFAPLLRWSFPLVSLTSLWAVLVAPSIGFSLIPAVCLFAAMVTVHFRTRYRVAMIPWLVLPGSIALANILPAHLSVEHWLLLAALYLFGIRLVRHPMLVET